MSSESPQPQTSGCESPVLHIHDGKTPMSFTFVVGQRLNELYDNILDSASHQFQLQKNSNANTITKLYTCKSRNGHKSYISDLGDLIETLDENSKKAELHLYLEYMLAAKSKPKPKLASPDSPHCRANAWSIQDAENYKLFLSQNQIQNEAKSEYEESESDSSSHSHSASASHSQLLQIAIDTSSSTSHESDAAFLCHEDPEITQQMIDDMLLSKYGYGIRKLVSNTSNGSLYVGIYSKSTKKKVIHPDNTKKNTHRNSIKLDSSPVISANHGYIFQTDTIKRVRIKKRNKCKKDVNNSDNVMKEAIILNYLTVQNNPPSNSIYKYLDFIETENAYYLVQEYGNNNNNIMRLDEFIGAAHQYISDKKLKLKHWRIIVKYLFWQLIVNMHWMHNQMKCCHLNLNASNVMVENVKFIENKKNGMFTISTKELCLKLVDFSESELFRLESNCERIKCAKYGVSSAKHTIYQSPKRVTGAIFNPIKADMYSVGIILFKMFTNDMPYKYPHISDSAYLALKNNKLLVDKSNGFAPIPPNSMTLIINLLNFDENKRINTGDVINNEWFKNYNRMYKYRIQQKAKSQIQRHHRQKHIYKLPYYTLL